MKLLLQVAPCISFIIFRQIRPTGNHFLSLKFHRRFREDGFFHSFFVDDIVFAYWEHKVISTSLVSLLGSRPDNYIAIAVIFTSVLKVP